MTIKKQRMYLTIIGAGYQTSGLMLKYEDGPIFKFFWARWGCLSWFPGFLNGQRLYGNFKAKTVPDKVKYLEEENYVPLSTGHQAKLWNQDQLFKKLSAQNPWDTLVHFPHVWKGKTETREGGALSQGYNISLLRSKFKITSRGLPASKWFLLHRSQTLN